MPQNRKGRCSGTTTAGDPCPAPGNRASGTCYWHDPTVSEVQKKAARARGHRAANQARLPLKFTKADFSSAEGARAALEEAADLVRSGKMSVSIANAVSKLAGTALKASEVAIAKRLVDIERSVKEREKAQKRR